MQEDDGDWIEVAAVDNLVYTMKNLRCGVKYKFRVRAENIHGYSEPSQSTDEIVLDPVIDESEELLKVHQIKPGGSFHDRFEILEELGKGRFGIVYRVTEKQSDMVLAAKIIKCIKAVDRKKVQEEINIMKSLQHPKLLQLSASFETQKEIIMLME